MDGQFTGTNLVPIDTIKVGIRLRATNPRHVIALKESIHTIGLLHPISVFLSPNPDGKIRWELIAGAHRLDACQSLGHRDIPVRVVAIGELQRQIAECDENLCGTKLTPVESALLTARRKWAYESLNPETRNGAVGNGRKKVRQIGEATRFTADTASRTGKSERGVQRDAERGNAIAPEILKEILHTNMDKGTVLDRLAATPWEDQPAKLSEIRLKSQDKTKRVLHRDDSHRPSPAGEPGTSAAALWIVEKLGQANAALFAHMLEQENIHVFNAQFRNMIGLSNTAGPTEGQVGHVLAGPASSDEADLICSTSDIEIQATPDTQQSDCGPVTFFEVPGEADEAPGPWQHGPRRPSNWRDMADVPENGDWCRECKGKTWWGSSSQSPGWHCGSCFDPPRHRHDLLLRSTAAGYVPSAAAVIAVEEVTGRMAVGCHHTVP